MAIAEDVQSTNFWVMGPACYWRTTRSIFVFCKKKERNKQTLCSWLEGKTAPLCHSKGVNSNCTLSLESLNRIKQLQLWSRPLTLTILIGGSLEKEIYKLGQSKEKPPEVYQVTTKRKEMERMKGGRQGLRERKQQNNQNKGPQFVFSLN